MIMIMITHSPSCSILRMRSLCEGYALQPSDAWPLARQKAHGPEAIRMSTFLVRRIFIFSLISWLTSHRELARVGSERVAISSDICPPVKSRAHWKSRIRSSENKSVAFYEEGSVETYTSENPPRLGGWNGAGDIGEYVGVLQRTTNIF